MLTAFEARDEPVINQVEWDAGNINTHIDILRPHRLFLTEFIDRLEALNAHATVDNLVRAESLVSAYLRLGKSDLEVQDFAISCCKEFEKIRAKYLSRIVEGNCSIDDTGLILLSALAKGYLQDLHSVQNSSN